MSHPSDPSDSFTLGFPSRRRYRPPVDDDFMRQLTPEECRRLADSFHDLPPEYRLTAEDCELLEEQLHGKPLNHGSADAGAQAMQRRLTHLLLLKAQDLTALEDAADRSTLLADLDDLNREIAETRERLADYRRLHGDQN